MTIEDFVREMRRRAGHDGPEGCGGCPITRICDDEYDQACVLIVSALREAGVIPPVTRHQEVKP